MKKYKIILPRDFLPYEENEMTDYMKKNIKNNPEHLKFCEKWHGKEITLLELENLMDEFKRVEFNGKEITVLTNKLIIWNTNFKHGVCVEPENSASHAKWEKD